MTHSTTNSQFETEPPSCSSPTVYLDLGKLFQKAYHFRSDAWTQLTQAIHSLELIIRLQLDNLDTQTSEVVSDEILSELAPSSEFETSGGVGMARSGPKPPPKIFYGKTFKGKDTQPSERVRLQLQCSSPLGPNWIDSSSCFQVQVQVEPDVTYSKRWCRCTHLIPVDSALYRDYLIVSIDLNTHFVRVCLPESTHRIT